MYWKLKCFKDSLVKKTHLRNAPVLTFQIHPSLHSFIKVTVASEHYLRRAGLDVVFMQVVMGNVDTTLYPCWRKAISEDWEFHMQFLPTPKDVGLQEPLEMWSKLCISESSRFSQDHQHLKGRGVVCSFVRRTVWDGGGYALPAGSAWQFAAATGHSPLPPLLSGNLSCHLASWTVTVVQDHHGRPWANASLAVWFCCTVTVLHGDHLQHTVTRLSGDVIDATEPY